MVRQAHGSVCDRDFCRGRTDKHQDSGVAVDLAGIGPAGPLLGEDSSGQASEVRASGQTTARMVGGGQGADRL